MEELLMREIAWILVIAGPLGVALGFVARYFYKNEACPCKTIAAMVFPTILGVIITGDTFTRQLTALLTLSFIYGALALASALKLIKKPKLNPVIEYNGCRDEEREGQIWTFDYIQTALFFVAFLATLIWALLLEPIPM